MDAQAVPAETMDAIYRNQRFIYDATRKYYLLGRDQLLADLDVPNGGAVLEIGCGTARNLIRAARLYPTAQLYGLDASSQMLQTARGKVKRAGLQERITLAVGNATNFSPPELFSRERFERIFISYTLSMVPSWREAVEQAIGCLTPGGVLHALDFGDFAALPGWARGAQLRWLRCFSVYPVRSLEQGLADIARRPGLELTVSRIYAGYAVKATLTLRC